MKGISSDSGEYLKDLKQRGDESHVYHSHQFVGLEIAMLLKDLAHKSLYIKMAKAHNADQLLALAKSVSLKRDIKAPGAYFMKLVQGIKKEAAGTTSHTLTGKYSTLFKRP